MPSNEKNQSTPTLKLTPARLALLELVSTQQEAKELRKQLMRLMMFAVTDAEEPSSNQLECWYFTLQMLSAVCEVAEEA